jgi:hypothetical protein
MILRLVIVAVAVAVAVVVALVVQRRRPSPPTNPSAYVAPVQVDRNDFPHPDAPWLVVVFTSATCDTCGDVRAKAAFLESSEVAFFEAEVGSEPELHARYAIEAVPLLVIADASGEVRRSFIGHVSSTHLWGAMAELREPGSVPQGCDAGDEPDHQHTD